MRVLVHRGRAAAAGHRGHRGGTGRPIWAGDGVVFSTPVINRRRLSTPDPDALDWHRPARHHVAFGFGRPLVPRPEPGPRELEIAPAATLFERLPLAAPGRPAEEIPFKPGDNDPRGC